jgi:hypothetical protein
MSAIVLYDDAVHIPDGIKTMARFAVGRTRPNSRKQDAFASWRGKVGQTVKPVCRLLEAHDDRPPRLHAQLDRLGLPLKIQHCMIGNCRGKSGLTKIAFGKLFQKRYEFL